MNKNKNIIYALTMIIAAVCAGSFGYLLSVHMHSRHEMETVKEIAYTETDVSVNESSVIYYTENQSKKVQEISGKKAINIPVDVSTLKKTNSDILAWIRIPGTGVDYPIAQHPTDDLYYLKHGPDGIYSSYGCPYIESCDLQPFIEFNTVVYGHNMNDGSMFASLHNYENQDFFNNHPDIYVYTTDHVYLYNVFAAVMYSDARIPYYFDDYIESDRTAFLESLKSDCVEARSIFSENMPVNKDCNIITLSTCDKKLRNKRFLVVAELKQIDGQDVS